MADWTKDQIIARIRNEADKQKIDPDLAVAVATQESYLNPNARGDNGNSLGLFQLQPAAAIDVGVNPQWRHEPGVNIYGGVKFLAQKLQQSKGNVENALRRYNGGGDPNYVRNVMRFFKPGVAEAAERPQGGTYTDTDVHNALKALQGTQEPTQPQGGTYGEEDVQNALRALQGTPGPATAPPQAAPAPTTQPGASQAPPEPSPDPSATPGMRFQALPSITQLPPAERMQKTKLFESLTPAMQEEFLRSEEPTAGGLAMGGGPVAQSQPVTDPAALLAMGGGQARAPVLPPQAPSSHGPDDRPWWQQQLMPRVTTPGPTGPPPDLDEGLTKFLEPAQKGMPGLLLGGAAGAVGSALGRGAASLLGRGASLLPVLGEVAGSYGGRQANVALGNEEPGTVGDVLSAAIPLASRAVGAIAPAIVKRLPGSAGAQHEMMAESLKELPAKMTPTTPSRTLYGAVVQQGNPAIPVHDLRQTAQELLALNAQRGAATRNPRVVRLAQEIEDLAKQYNNQVPMDVLYDRMQGAGEILKQARRTGGRGERDLSRIYAGFHGSLENAAQSGIPGAETLQQAIKASRQEHAVDRLGRIVGQGRGIEEQAGSGYTFVKGKKMLSEFDRLVADDPVFAGSFPNKADLDEIRGLFQSATKLPALPSAGGAQYGSGRAAVRASIGSMIGGPAGAAIAVSGPEVIARAMMTAPGRAMLRAALEGRGGLTPQALAVLNTALREQLPAEK